MAIPRQKSSHAAPEALSLRSYCLCQLDVAIAESRLSEFVSRITPQEFFPQATRFGEPQGDPPFCRFSRQTVCSDTCI